MSCLQPSLSSHCCCYCHLLLLQHLQDMHQSGQLLLPLQHNQDVRAIRAVPAIPEQPQPLQQQQQPPQSKQTSNTAVTGSTAGTSNVCSFAEAQDTSAAVEQLLALDGPVDAAAVAAACQGLGFSLVLRDMPKRSRAVAELVGALEQQLGLPAGANLYYTPAGALLCCWLWLLRK
jgi:hypothetical protein